MTKQIAQGIAELGRNGDSMLVHMTPREVQGLQSLAMAHGGSLTVNPKTGLPEAGFLSSFLPMLAGIATTAMGFGPVGAGIAGGLTGLATANKGANPLLSFGLGAMGGYGGGGLGETLGMAGTSAPLEAEAIRNLGQAGGSNALIPGESFTEQIDAARTQAQQQAARDWANADASTRADALGKGLGAVADNPMKYLTKSNMMTLGSALVPVGMAALNTKPVAAVPNVAPARYYSTKFNPGTQVVDAQGRATYTGRGYEPGTFTTEYPTIYQAAQGGPVPSPNDNAMYPMSNLASGKAGFNVQSSPTANEVVGGYDARIDPFTGAQMMAGGGFLGIGGSGGELTGAVDPNSLFGRVLGPAGRQSSIHEYGYNPADQSYTDYGYDVLDENGNPVLRHMAMGGIASLPEYAAGGKLLSGPGDGMSDDIPAVIKGHTPQRAALADGEFVVPADVVSHLGNGSTQAGAKQLYKMMDKIRQARTGNPKQGKQINPDKFMPA
jgi:hypothetical protein